MAEKKTEGMLGSYDANGNYVDPNGVTFYDGFTGKNLNNADTEKSAYGDDATADTYNQYQGGTNDKYTGENTKNTYTGYNADIKTADLNPDYQYGGLAQQQESIEDGYIANRNDNIASALYNEGLRSKEDVANYLSQQQGFMNSTEEQRQNTINSIWKRIGSIGSQNQQSDANNTEPTNTPQDTNNEALSNMESDLNKSTAGELYGKVTAEEGNPQNGINTLEDANSIYRQIDAKRIETFKDLQAMDSQSIAAAIVSGAMASDTQAMRDLMQYNPAKYQEVKQAEKQLIGQMNINNIASGSGEWTTSATNGQSGISNEIADFALSSSNGTTSTADILKSVNSSLNSNQNAATASEQMSSIEADMATLQNRLKNLKREASQVFKGDVPAYIVGAYISNRTMEIQDQLSILENRYNAAYSRYQQEWEQTKWNAEFGLKQQELQLKRESMALDDWATKQGIELKWEELNKKYSAGGTSTTVTGNTVQTTSLSRQEIGSVVDNLVTQCQNGQLGKAQCAAGVQKNYFPYLGVDLGSLSAYSAKQGICNELAGEYTPQKGDIVVMSSKTQPKYGHMGMVVGIEGNTMTYLDWNGTVKDGVGTEEPAIRTIQLTDSKLYGYYNPTKTEGSANGYSYDWEKDYATDFYRMDPEKFSKLSNDARKEAYRLAGGENAFYEKRKLYNDEVVKKEGQKQGLEVLTSIAELYDMASNDDGKLDLIRGIGRMDGTKDKFDQIKEQLKLETLLEARANGATFGSMTEGEWKIIERAASSLKWGRFDSTINDEMEKVIAAVYHATYGREMTKSDRNNFKNNVKDKNNWNNTIEEEYSVTDILSA